MELLLRSLEWSLLSFLCGSFVGLPPSPAHLSHWLPTAQTCAGAQLTSPRPWGLRLSDIPSLESFPKAALLFLSPARVWISSGSWFLPQLSLHCPSQPLSPSGLVSESPPKIIRAAGQRWCFSMPSDHYCVCIIGSDFVTVSVLVVSSMFQYLLFRNVPLICCMFLVHRLHRSGADHRNWGPCEIPRSLAEALQSWVSTEHRPRHLGQRYCDFPVMIRFTPVGSFGALWKVVWADSERLCCIYIAFTLNRAVKMFVARAKETALFQGGFRQRIGGKVSWCYWEMQRWRFRVQSWRQQWQSSLSWFCFFFTRVDERSMELLGVALCWEGSTTLQFFSFQMRVFT